MRLEDIDACRAVMGLLEGLSHEEIRAFGIEALRRWRRRPPPREERDPVERYTRDVFSMHGDFGVELIKILAEREELRNPDTNRWKEVFIDDAALHKQWMCGVLEFVWWLVRAGLAIDLVYGRRDERNERAFPTMLRLTTRGARLLDGSDDNPLLPGFLDRIRDLCPGLPDGVVALLVDARACLDHSLLRPSVVLMGVAYELAIENVVEKLELKGLIKTKTSESEAGVRRLTRIRELLRTDEKIKPLLPDRVDRRRAEAAYDFADVLRRRRNDAAHTKPAYDFENARETEEFLVAAGWHLPAIWSLAVADGS